MTYEFAREEATRVWAAQRGLKPEDAYIFGVY